MSNIADTWSRESGLRERAVTRITNGIQIDPPHPSASEAMAVLFKLASSTSTIDDARSLLHELQVHQVEVEMQQEELLRSRAELESNLIRQTSLIERSPAGLLVVDEVTVLCEINQAGARMLGAASDVVLGRPLTSFLSVPSSDQLHKMLARVPTNAVPETCELELLPQDGVTSKLLCSADTEASSGRYLLVLLAPPSPS